jgi:hypothetical protein
MRGGGDSSSSAEPLAFLARNRINAAAPTSRRKMRLSIWAAASISVGKGYKVKKVARLQGGIIAPVFPCNDVTFVTM